VSQTRQKRAIEEYSSPLTLSFENITFECSRMHLQVMTDDLYIPTKKIAPHQAVSYGALVFNTAV
jgi:hypothetical protein